MALSVKESGKTSLDHARKASKEIKEKELATAKMSLAKAEMSAGKHLKMIQYQIERHTAVQDHYKQQEKDLTTKINSILANERSLESQKSAAETQLSCENNELSRYQNDLSSAESRLRDAERRRKEARDNKVKLGAAAGFLTLLTFGAAAAVAPLAFGAAAGAFASGQAETDAENDIRRCRGSIEDKERSIREHESNISSLRSKISQLSNDKSRYNAQRSQLQEEKGKIKKVITFLHDALMYGGEYSTSAQQSIDRTALTGGLVSKAEAKGYSPFDSSAQQSIDCTALTGKVVSKAEAKGYSLFDSNGTERILNSFKEAWDTFEEMNKKGDSYNFEMDFQCTRCSKSSHEFPHVKDGQLICFNCK